MKSQEKSRCPLCERHQRMQTTSGMLFWVEWPYGDCCCSYAVELRGEWTVQEFVKAVLERNPCEWGFFYIQRAGQKWYEAQVKIEYQYGNLKSTVPEKIARKKIKRVHSNGGWSLMDYWIET